MVWIFWCPEDEDAAELHRIIYEELGQGKFLHSARARCRRIIARLAERGAQGIILGCTELPMLVKQDDSAVPLFDTTQIHALAAVEAAMAFPSPPQGERAG